MINIIDQPSTGIFRFPENELQLLQEAVKSKSLPSVDR